MKRTKLLLPITIVNFLALLCVMLTLPAQIPIHMNFAYEIDGWGSRWTVAIVGLLPIVLALLRLLYNKLTENNPAIKQNRRVEAIVIPCVIYIMTVFTWIPILMAKQAESASRLPMELIVGLPLGILMIVFGNYMGVIKQNRTLGIRTPWTLKSETVWLKTHRKGAYTACIGGVLLLLSSLACYFTGLAPVFFAGLIVSILLTALYPVLYSYVLYKKERDS